MLEREELLAVLRRERGGSRVRLLAGVLLLAAWFLGLMLLQVLLQLVEGRSETAALAILILYLFLIPVLVMIGRWLQWRRLPVCGHCGAKLERVLLRVAIASGNCGACGGRIYDRSKLDA